MNDIRIRLEEEQHYWFPGVRVSYFSGVNEPTHLVIAGETGLNMWRAADVEGGWEPIGERALGTF